MSDIAERVRGEIVKNEGSSFLSVYRRIDEVRKDHEEFRGIVEYIKRNIGAIYNGGLTNIFQNLKMRLTQDLVFLDIESCGFSRGDPINTISITKLNGELGITSAFALDYFQEKGILTYCLDNILPPNRTTLTFNGNAFDIDRIDARARANGIFASFGGKAEQPLLFEGYSGSVDMARQYMTNGENGNGQNENYLIRLLNGRHHDLMRYASMLFKQRRVNPRSRTLKTLEKVVFDTHRVGDISGSKIPQEYRRFIYEGGNEEEVAKIIEHNILDSVTLVALLIYFIKGKYD